ncbi:hypothetical protein A9239_03385 [Methanosarcina sp. A14]|uniref:AAA domain-containing protein n=1 Tax=Methanosarcina barkeri MS TaxID=1434108 RepID=A0A0E3QSI4_METBA|nr:MULTISPECIES: DUF3696 domain-containing protein [Methanosarcina]AKB54214.1 hypothetical protein MSBRM_1216 [Methanosarcina barkeri MS]OEC91192.1 hypothetical protein A9239_03385 [Methanosarcina sp. A14]
MLKRIKIKNFKALKNIDSLDIKPITFFVGPNSSGKSSAFQVLLALKQTVKSSDENTPLILQDYIDLGSYKDIIWNHDEKQELEIEFDVGSNSYNSEDSLLKRYKFVYKLVKRGFYAGEIILNKYSYNEYKTNEIKEKLVSFNVSWLGKNKYSFTIEKPDIFAGKISVYRKNISQFIPVKLLDNDKHLKNGQRYLQPFIVSNEANRDLDAFFRSMSHIGPSRTEPKRLYTQSGAAPHEVGKYGQWAVDEILLSKEMRFLVKKWFKEFNISSEFKLEELRKGSRRYEILLKDYHTGTWVTIADVGFGVSQLLPIIVECFNPDSSTLLIEQPEIHLHPKGQASMGDLLVDSVNNLKKSIIVETHSDLIISRVCTHVVKGDISPDDVAIYYFDPSTDGTKILRIDINEDGQMVNFPEGFFEERFNEVVERTDIVFDKMDEG